MADKTTGEREPVKISTLPMAPDILDELFLPGELRNAAVRVAGTQIKDYAQVATRAYVGTAVNAAKSAKEDAERSKNYADTVQVDYDYIEAARKDAQGSAAAAAGSATSARGSADSAAESARTATEAAGKVSTEVVKEASEKMQGWMDTAEKAAKTAVTAETGAEGAAKAAGDCVTQAKASENKAKEYADTAKEYANQTAGNVPAVTVGWDADGYFSWFENKEDV